MASTLMSMRQQLLGWFLLVGLLPLLLLAAGLQWHLERTLVAEKQLQLYNMAREKGHLVRELVLAAKGQAEAAAALPSLVQFLANTQDPYVQHLQRISEFSRRLMAQNGYYDMLLVNATGKVVFTVMGESDRDADLTSAAWKDTLSGMAFDQAKQLMTTVITPYRFYEPSQRRVAFVATPVWDNAGVWMGVLLVQLNDNWLASVSTSQMGLGTTGEVLLSQYNGVGALVAAAPLRLYPNAVQKGFLLDAKQKNITAHHAMRGEEGWGESVDYRGVPVLAGWVHIPALQMGLVVKQDTEEVFAPLVSQRYLIASLFILLMMLVGWAMLIVSRQFVAPIQAVSQTAAALAQGRWHLRLPETAHPNVEIQQLALGINHLAQTVELQLDKLQQQTTELEEQASELENYAHNLEDLVSERTQALERLSLVDPMTGLFNRRHYMNEAPKLWRQAARNQQLLLFIMLDVDKFKEYNDTQGHQAGDNALIRVAQVLQESCQRSSDVVLRMGGEEMAVLSLVQDQQEANAIAERILMSVQMCAIPHPASSVLPVLTVSIGVAIFDGTTCDAPVEPNMDKLYALADAALYQAKSTGRNRAVIASEWVKC